MNIYQELKQNFSSGTFQVLCKVLQLAVHNLEKRLQDNFVEQQMLSECLEEALWCMVLCNKTEKKGKIGSLKEW